MRTFIIVYEEDSRGGDVDLRVVLRKAPAVPALLRDFVADFWDGDREELDASEATVLGEFCRLKREHCYHLRVLELVGDRLRAVPKLQPQKPRKRGE